MTCQTCMGKGSYFIAQKIGLSGNSAAVEIKCPDCCPPVPLGSYQTDSFKTQIKEEPYAYVDPVKAHMAHCTGCATCDAWRVMLNETKPRKMRHVGWYDHHNQCFYTSQKDADFAASGGNLVVMAWVPESTGMTWQKS